MSGYRAYAGIGSRDTPDEILIWMRKIGGYLMHQGWTLRSGSAPGADLAFEHGVNRELGNTMTNGQDRRDKEIYLPWPEFMGSTSQLHPKAYPFTEEEIGAAAHFHPAWAKCSDVAKKFHIRNVRQMVGCRQIHEGEQIPSRFVVCWTEGGKIRGGTGQALRIAEYLNIPVINLGRASNEDELKTLLLELDELQEKLK